MRYFEVRIDDDTIDARLVQSLVGLYNSARVREIKPLERVHAWIEYKRLSALLVKIHRQLDVARSNSRPRAQVTVQMLEQLLELLETTEDQIP